MVFSFFSKANSKSIEVGSPAPQTHADIMEAYKKSKVLVFFYPKADTPGCTAQACSLRDHFSDLSDKGVQVFGVSTDTPEDQEKFKAKYRLPFPLISDKDKSICKAFGVSTTLGFASRQAFLMDQGKIIWLDRSASTKEQADDVLKILNAKDTP